MKLEASYKQIFNLSLPLIASNLFHHLVGVVDTLFMGRIGEAQLAACGLSSLFFFILVMIPFSYSIGIQIIVARRAGEGRHREVGELMDHSIYLIGTISLILFLLVRYLSPHVLILLLQDEDIYRESIRYLSYRSFEFLVGVFVYTFYAFFTGIGKTQILLWSTMLMFFTNVFFNYSLVFGEFGFPRMEIAGAALASVISQAAAFLLCLAYTFHKRYPTAFNLFSFNQWLPDLIRKVLKLANPIVVQQIIGMVAWFLFFILIEKMGSAELAVSNIIKEIYLLLGITTWGLGNATNTLVSNVIGQGKGELVFVLLKKVITLSLAFAGLSFIAVIFLGPDLIALFTKDSGLRSLGYYPMLVAAVSLMLMSVSIPILRAVSGTGATRFVLKIEVVTILCYATYTVLMIRVFKVSLAAAWTGEFIYWIVLGALCYLYLVRGSWREIHV